MTKEPFFPAGHFYSPIPDLKEAAAALDRANTYSEIGGIEIDDKEMLALWRCMLPSLTSLPFGEHDQDGSFRFHFNNDMYSYGDAAIYYGITKKFAPKRVVEVGSGFSSALAIDMREIFNRPTELTFIEPFPSTLNSLLREGDRETVNVVVKKVQDVPLSIFGALDEDDILFIDSSHVAKTGSDVCFEIFDILPRLKRGVLGHFHDCFCPFEYPRQWVLEQNRSWNELYFLRAFLMFNSMFRVIFFNHYFSVKYPNQITGTPLAKNPGGGLWLRKEG